MVAGYQAGIRMPPPTPTYRRSSRRCGAIQTHYRPRLKRYDDTLVLVLKTVDYADHDGLRDVRHFVKAGEVMIAVGPGFVITVRDTASTAASLRCANRCISRRRS